MITKLFTRLTSYIVLLCYTFNVFAPVVYAMQEVERPLANPHPFYTKKLHPIEGHRAIYLAKQNKSIKHPTIAYPTKTLSPKVLPIDLDPTESMQIWVDHLPGRFNLGELANPLKKDVILDVKENYTRVLQDIN